MKWPYFLLAGAVILVLGFGLTNLIKEDIVVAPWTKTAIKGRLMGHTKNVTRILQLDPATLHEYLKEAINYEGVTIAEQPPTEADWPRFVRESIPANSRARHVLLLPATGEKALAWSLPALYYAYYYGSPVVFVTDGQVDQDEAQRYRNRPAYLIGPESLVPDAVGESFAAIERVVGRSLADHAVKVAEFRDEATEFGWGRPTARPKGSRPPSNNYLPKF